MTEDFPLPLPATRLLLFIGLLLALMAAEMFWPRQTLPQRRATRWTGNLSLSILGSLCGQALLTLSPVAAALWAQQAGYGLLHLVSLPEALRIGLSLLILDGLIWAQHLAFHHVPLLWRLHRVHHTDPMMDVTTAVRFHPVEIAISLLLKSGAVIALGIPATAIIAFEILLSSAALLTHANIRLPERIEATLRLLVITPDLHRIHHSPDRTETDSNFGFCLSLWDRLAGTLRPNPIQPQQTMVTGLTAFRSDRDQRPDRLLVQPLRPTHSPDQQP